MSLHVAKFSFNVSGHLHPQLLIEFPLFLYLRCTRAKGKKKKKELKKEVLFAKADAVIVLTFREACVHYRELVP